MQQLCLISFFRIFYTNKVNCIYRTQYPLLEWIFFLSNYCLIVNLQFHSIKSMSAQFIYIQLFKYAQNSIRMILQFYQFKCSHRHHYDQCIINLALNSIFMLRRPQVVYEVIAARTNKKMYPRLILFCQR